MNLAIHAEELLSSVGLVKKLQVTNYFFLFRSSSGASSPHSSPLEVGEIEVDVEPPQQQVEVAPPAGVTQQQLQPEQPEQTYDDDVTYEPITEPFMFEDQIIYPCYVTLPFVTDLVIEAACNPRDTFDVSRLNIILDAHNTILLRSGMNKFLGSAIIQCRWLKGQIIPYRCYTR